MTNKATKRALLTSVFSLLLCFVMLIGTTFAWFTDTVTSTGNIIKSGTLDVEMYYADGKEAPDAATWKDASIGAIFNYDLWEPGYVDVKHIKIANVGSLALKYNIAIVANGLVSDLADVIDVYYADPAVQVADRAAVANATKLGTLTQVLAGMPESANGTLEAGKTDVITLALKMQETAGNEYQNKSIGTDFSVILTAAQLEAETDSFGTDYDADATYEFTYSPVYQIPETSTGDVVLTTSTNNESAVTVPAEVIEGLPNDVKAVQLKVTAPVADGNVVNYDDVALVDQTGREIDLSANTEDIDVKLFVGKKFAGRAVVVKHNNVVVASSVVVDSEGYVTYTTKHFCKITIEDVQAVLDADKALLAGEDAVLPYNLTFNASLTKANSGYGATGFKVAGGTLDGNGKTLSVEGAGATWGCAVNITAGTIKNLTIKKAMRGIFMGGATGDVYIDNVVIDGTVYTFNSDAGNKNYGVYISNTTLNGWTSHSDAHKEVVYTNCKFGKGSGYAFCRPYGPTEFVGCDFSAGYEIDPRGAVTFKNCTVGGVALTAENLATLVTSNIANATVVE